MRNMSLTLAPDDLGVLGNLTGTERKRGVRECVENACSIHLKRIRIAVPPLLPDGGRYTS